MEIDKIILICLIILVIGYFAYKYFFQKDTSTQTTKSDNQDKKDKLEKLEQPETQSSQTKELKYFGGDYCPFSNTTSNAYRVIKEFEDKYTNRANVKYYWIGKDDEEMKGYNIQYVPTILNGENTPIEIELPKDTDTNNLSNEELKDILFENIYNKL